MSKANTHRRRKVPPIVAVVLQPVAKRLSRMEALLFEMRHEQDVQLKRVTSLQAQLETLTEYVRGENPIMQQMSPPRKGRVRSARG
jgi:hypothetical protein